MLQIQQSTQQVRQRIAEACERSGRKPEDVLIIAVTKYVSEATTRLALEAGLTHIGESKVQDALPKYDRLGNLGTWHFIGHLQTNKAKDIIGRFSYVHSLDRDSLAKELNKRGKQSGTITKCFVQVNISGEQTKFGISPKEVLEFVRKTSTMEYINICGLMTMAPYTDRVEDTRPIFRRLRELRDEVRQLDLPNVSADHLSMGMSNDFEVAIEEGATFIRLGSVLVGQEIK
jgi:pyridoxal phosphate enzyme (YggS family)